MFESDRFLKLDINIFSAGSDEPGDCLPSTRYSTDTPRTFAIFTAVSTLGRTPLESIYERKVL